ncbi:glycosyltransferase family A protein [Arthrobacter oryzae]|uniref:Glycosyltransferase family 2 protein n=1 Tax=Arthrobacter oryzae TaxID=409290 RepID=A0A3N0BLF3_9MICC|nr:glycosyltransferase family A protein [Arthrobacter oryzae]RNL49471.1 glycosyltransferase family 2 protein [Arthrobacter oryzae]
MKPKSLSTDFRSLEEGFSALAESELRSLALQTRSQTIRDYLSREITGGLHDFEQFVEAMRSETPRAIVRPRTAALLAQIVTGQRLDPNDLRDALAIFEQLFHHYNDSFLNTEEKILYTDLLDRVGRADMVVSTVDSLRIAEHAPAEALVLVANAALTSEGVGTESWLSALNSLLAVDELAPLNLAPGTAPVLDRLESTNAAASIDGPLVTVIVPTWNPGPWLWTAVRSLTQQTYANLQILVMDDRSSPQFTPQLERLLAMDSRIQVITSPENRGTYASRNAAVRDYAHGDYVTIQDDDDWSHPQRIERQVKFSQSRGLAVGMARAARVTEDLRFVRRSATFIRRGYPTTLISRTTFSELGFWDPVRRNSDFEFIRRVRRSKKPTGDLGQAPLMLQRHREGSLSSSEVWEGYSDQPRRWQNWLAAEWHERSASAGKRIYMGTGLGLQRPYPAPVGLTRSAHSNTPTRIDALIISDCGHGSPTEPKTLALADALLAEGKTVGLLHIDGLRPLADTVSTEMAALTRQPGVFILSWGDETATDVAHIVDSGSLLLCDTVQSKIFAREAVVYDPRDSIQKAACRLLHIDSPEFICHA